MPELPEIASWAKEMQEHLTGKQISSVEIIQPKCLNITPDDFQKNVSGALIRATTNRGKWILTELDTGWLLFNLGMGGEILLIKDNNLPQKYRLVINFLDGDKVTVNFWWFGFVHYCSNEGINEHPQVSKLGRSALELTVDDLGRLIGQRRTAIKTILLDQTCIAGIGNAYIHDILFLARLHPLRPANSLNMEDQAALINAIHRGLEPSLEKGGAFYELDLFGQKGGFKSEDILVGYREGQPCPVCKTPIAKIKTGSTSSYLCVTCQVMT
jgi:formamidopyrimidine-DNA glycosylase